MLSVTMAPSSRLTTRWAYSAWEWEWVTMTMVVPSSLSWLRSCITSSPLTESRLPVGSSARISLGHVAPPVGDLHPFQRFLGALLALAGGNVLVIEQRQLDILSHVQLVDPVE